MKTIGIIIDLTRSSRRDFLSGFLNAADTGRTWNIQLIQSKETLTSKTVQNWVDGAVVTQDYADEIGADFYAKDAMRTVRFAESLR